MSSCLIVVGEKSGEEHVLGFYHELVKLCPHTAFYGVGGDALIGQGFEALYHLRDFSSMGLSEVVAKLPHYREALRVLEREVVGRKTTTAILVDFQEFNLLLAQRLHQRGVRVLYYVAPQAWAWRSGRVRKLARVVDTLFTLLPFEQAWFRQRGVARVKAVRHPLLKKYHSLLAARLQTGEAKPRDSGPPRILLLPGSRRQEVAHLLPEFLWAVEHLADQQEVAVAMVQASSLGPEVFLPFDFPFCHIYAEQELPEALEWADICLATSGTVTLCCALFQVPTIVAYKVNLLNAMAFEIFVRYRGYICLANIVHQQMVFPEFSGNAASGVNILQTLKLWLTNQDLCATIRKKLACTAHYLGGEDFNVAQYMASVILAQGDGGQVGD